MSTFLDLIAPLSADDFFSDHYGRSFHIGKPSADAGPLFGWADLNSVLSRLTVEDRKQLKLAKGVTLDCDPDDIWLPNGDLASEAVAQKIRSGHTFIFDSIHLHSNRFRRLARDLEQVFRQEVYFNCYVSMRPEVGFGLHWDDHDVFAIQLEGRKYWVIHDFTDKSPVDRATTAPLPEGAEPIWEGYLNQGEVLYLPRGMWHSAVSTGKPSMHITCGVHGHKPMDVLKWVLACAEEQAALRGSFHPPVMPSDEKAEMARQIRE